MGAQVGQQGKKNLDISDSGAIALAQGIEKCPQLQVLSFTNNQISDSGAIALAQGIEMCPQLQMLDLHNNQISDSGATAVAAAIPKCMYLTSLSLSDNEISTRGLNEVRNSLQRGKALRSLRYFVIGGSHYSLERSASHIGTTTTEGHLPYKPSPVASFVQKKGDNALLHLVAEYLAASRDGGSRR